MQHLVEHRVLVGDVVVDAIGAAEDKREELERKRTKAIKVDFGSFGSPSEKNFAIKQQVGMLLGLGREILVLLKLVMAAVMVLCVLCFIVVMKK